MRAKNFKIFKLVFFHVLLFLQIAFTNASGETVGNPFVNFREGRSRLITSDLVGEVNQKYKQTNKLNILKSIISDNNYNRCASKVVKAIKEKLDLSHDRDLQLAILGLRLDNSLDDISASILLETIKLNKLIPIPIVRDGLSADEEDRAMEIFQDISEALKNKNLCIEDTYRSLVAELNQKSPKFIKNLKHINKLALENGIISSTDFNSFELLRFNKVYNWPLSLGEYATGLSNISRMFPTREHEYADLMTDVKLREKKSLRQALYEKYNSTQILLIGNLVKSLKHRLDATEVTINVNYVDQATEVIALSPMEKFRFILKLMRKELAEINNSNVLAGRPATYMDIIAASYEVGFISSNEIATMASLQEIWNPSITPKDKAIYWSKTFGGIASIFLPPPFGFLAVMAIMVIDQQVADAPINHDSDFNLM